MKRTYRYNIEYSVQGAIEMNNKQYKEFINNADWLPNQGIIIENILNVSSLLPTSDDIVNIELREIEVKEI